MFASEKRMNRKQHLSQDKDLFEATIMYFGFSNAPVIFQSIMNNILGDLICIRLVIVYLDNILIFGTCLKEHRQLVKEVLKRL